MAFASDLMVSAGSGRAEESRAFTSRSALAASGWPSTSTTGGGSAAKSGGGYSEERDEVSGEARHGGNSWEGVRP